MFNHFWFDGIIRFILWSHSQLDGLIEDGIQDTNTVQDKVNNAIQTMRNLTSSANELSAGDLGSSLDILEKVVDLTNSTGLAIKKEVITSYYS